jgi:hypothetical protein
MPEVWVLDVHRWRGPRERIEKPTHRDARGLADWLIAQPWVKAVYVKRGR